MEAGQRLELLESHKLYPVAARIIARLSEQGFQTVFAGGCVRDSLLGVAPNDLDLATSAPPDAVEAAFSKTLAVGKAFGTIVVVEEGQNFEVTTFRSDGPYLDGRHPSTIEFSNMIEDAKRRDFTVNALFYDTQEGVIDHVGGIKDLHLKKLRAVGDARARFQEDRLRMLRAVRFVGQLGFELDTSVTQAIEEEHRELKLVSIERVFNEVKRLLESKHMLQGMSALMDSHLFEFFWPELRGFDSKSLEKFSGALVNWENVFAAICWLQGIQDPEARLRAWKVSRESLKRIQHQLQAIRTLKTSTVRAERVRALGSDSYAEVLALAGGIFPQAKIAQWLEEYTRVAARDGGLPKPFLSGEDLQTQGVPPGEAMGRILKEAFDAQLEGRVRTRAQALEFVKKFKA